MEASIKTSEKKIKRKKGIIETIKSSRIIQSYLLLSLPLIGFFVFTIYPILWSALKALYYFDNIPSNTQFVGIQNFVNLLGDKNYWSAWITTFKLALYKLPFEVPLALIVAILLMNTKRFAGFFRTMYFMPQVVSISIVGVIFTNLFDCFGFINAVIEKINPSIGVIDWFQSPTLALVVLILGSLWSGFGINVLYFSAALTNVPDELYEAAEIDGAGAVRKFFSVTLPMISPVFQTILLLAINGTLHIGEYIIVMTNGAPAGTTHTVGSYVISTFLPGFSSGNPNIGYGCAMALCSSVIYGLVALIYLRVSKKMQEVY